jgi:hypothetical protein
VPEFNAGEFIFSDIGDTKFRQAGLPRASPTTPL